MTQLLEAFLVDEMNQLISNNQYHGRWFPLVIIFVRFKKCLINNVVSYGITTKYIV